MAESIRIYGAFLSNGKEGQLMLVWDPIYPVIPVACIIAALSGYSAPSFAEREAKTLGKDLRVKFVKYDETDVVKLYGHDLVMTEIIFAPEILDIAIVNTLT